MISEENNKTMKAANKKQLMAFALENPLEVRWLSISNRQAKIANYVRGNQGADLIEVANAFSVSHQSAGRTLRSLVQKGYLGRYRAQRDSGGYHYEYWCDI